MTITTLTQQHGNLISALEATQDALAVSAAQVIAHLVQEAYPAATYLDTTDCDQAGCPFQHPFMVLDSKGRPLADEITLLDSGLTDTLEEFSQALSINSPGYTVTETNHATIGKLDLNHAGAYLPPAMDGTAPTPKPGYEAWLKDWRYVCAELEPFVHPVRGFDRNAPHHLVVQHQALSAIAREQGFDAK